MKYIKFTYVDSITNIGINKDFAINGPKFPDIIGLDFKWERVSKHPTLVPEFFGVCSDDADTNAEGVLEVLTEESYNTLYAQELMFQKITPQIVSAKVIRLRLLDLGLLDKVTAAINSLPQELQIEWNYGTEYNNQSLLIAELTKALELTDEILTEIFISEDDYQELKIRKQEIQRLENEKT